MPPGFVLREAMPPLTDALQKEQTLPPCATEAIFRWQCAFLYSRSKGSTLGPLAHPSLVTAEPPVCDPTGCKNSWYSAHLIFSASDLGEMFLCLSPCMPFSCLSPRPRFPPHSICHPFLPQTTSPNFLLSLKCPLLSLYLHSLFYQSLGQLLKYLKLFDSYLAVFEG